MSNFHILTQANDKKTVNVVFHIPVPAAGTNEANVSWRDAVVAEAGGSANIVSVLGAGVDPTEDTQLKAGALVEKQATVRFSSINLTPAEKKAEIEAFYNQLAGSDPKYSILEEKKVTLEWIGYSANVS